MSEEVEKDIYMLRRHQEQMEDIYAQVEIIEGLIKEYETTADTLIEIQKFENGRDALMPVGGNVFLYASIKETKKVVAKVGGKVFMEKNVNRAIDFVNKRIEELKKNEEALVKTARDIKEKMDAITKRLKDKNVQVS
ncbi:MAG: prefoldin subunit alpha [Thermoplasmata archaeon]|nr:prefoldin subunit alpha [Thermoplasmata archaeon]